MPETINWSRFQGENRPQCSVPNCSNYAGLVQKNQNGLAKWRAANWIKKMYPQTSNTWCCASHHNKNTAVRHGVKSSIHLTAKRAGLSLLEFRAKNHPYLWARKDYCENIDGRIGFVCNTVLPTREMLNAAGLTDWEPMQFLEVDHIDGNHTHNDIKNLQTLCKHCHTIKSYKYEDYLTPGRKTRGSNK